MNPEDPIAPTDDRHVHDQHEHAHDDHDHGDGGHGHAHDEHGHDDHGHGHDHGDGGHGHEHPTGLWAAIKEIFAPHSHDSADSVDSALESSAKGIRAVKISLVALMVTAVAQVAIVAVTGSVALLADTIHNFSDALTSIPLWIAFLIGRRAANRTYTYGYRRAEDLSGLFIIFMIALSAVLAGWESIHRLIDPREVENLWLVGAAGVVGFIGNELVALYRIRVGRDIGSAALIADGHHARTDGLTSLAVVFGAIGVGLGFPAADPIIGLMITVAILFVLKGAAVNIFRRLMDGVEPEVLDQIETVAGKVSGVEAVDRLRVRWVGHRLDANLSISVDRGASFSEAHAIAEDVEASLIGSVGKLDSVVVAVVPAEFDTSGMSDNGAGNPMGGGTDIP